MCSALNVASLRLTVGPEDIASKAGEKRSTQSGNQHRLDRFSIVKFLREQGAG